MSVEAAALLCLLGSQPPLPLSPNDVLMCSAPSPFAPASSLLLCASFPDKVNESICVPLLPTCRRPSLSQGEGKKAVESQGRHLAEQGLRLAQTE